MKCLCMFDTSFSEITLFFFLYIPPIRIDVLEGLKVLGSIAFINPSLGSQFLYFIQQTVDSDIK